MKLKGNVTIGAMHGKELLKKYYLRLINILGYEPFKGTLDIKLEKSIDIKHYTKNNIEHILLDGSVKVYAYLAPVIVSAKGQDVDCWAIRQPESVYEDDLLEIIYKENLREKLSLQNGDEVEITFFEQRQKKNIPGLGLIRKIYGVDRQLMKS